MDSAGVRAEAVESYGELCHQSRDIREISPKRVSDRSRGHQSYIDTHEI